MRINSKNIVRFWLIGFLLIATDFLHFFKPYEDYRDLLLVFSVLTLTLYYLLQKRKKPCKFDNHIIAVAPLFMCAISSIVPAIIFRQSFFAALLAQRHFYLIFLSYYPLRIAFNKKDLTIDRVLKYINIIATAELAVVVVQCFLRKYVIFTTLVFSQFIKYGAFTNRMGLFDGPIIILALFCWIQNIMVGRDPFKNSIKVFFSLYVFFVFGQTRMIMASLVAVLVVSLVMYQGKKIVKVILCFMIPVVIFAFTKTSFFTMILSALDGSLIGTSYDTVSIRLKAIELYLNGFLNSWFVGMGSPHESCITAYQAAGFYDNIFLVDNGVFAFVYVYGILGIFFYYLVYVKKWIISFKLFKKTNIIYYLLFFTYFICSSISIMPFYLYEIYGISLVLILVMLEQQKTNN